MRNQKLFNTLDKIFFGSSLSITDQEIDQIIRAVEEDSSQKERFKMPTDKQVIEIAILFNDGKLDADELTNMVSMCDFILDRLYENNDVGIPCSRESVSAEGEGG